VSVERLRPIMEGDLHSVERCAWCGARGRREQVTPRIETRLILWTMAPGPVCVDRIACARRREISRRAVA